MDTKTPTPADIRGEIARHWHRPLYLLAAEIGLHPVSVSAVLHERLPLKPELALRILERLQRAEREQR